MMESQRPLTTFLAWLLRRPDGISDDIARLYAIGRLGYPIATATHVLMLGLFWWLAIWPLVFFNIASVLLWTIAGWRLERHGELRWSFISCTMIEVPLHGVIATYYLGVQSGFFLYILASVILTVLAPFISRTVRFSFSGFFVLVLAATGSYVIAAGPSAPVPTEWDVFFFCLNSVTLSAMLAAFMALYEFVAYQAEAKLVDSNLRTEEVNKSLETVSRQLAKYISPQLYQAIVSGQQKVRVDSKRKKLTVFFSDIAGFTETTDQLESEELTSLLNEYLTEMSRIAQDYGANFDKFIGDAIVLYFGDPETEGVKEDAIRCVRMAIAMQQRMRELQERWRDQGLERPFEIRVGINTGYCTVGNFGSEDRMDYTIIGGEVNLAARLESHCETGGILLSNETYSLVKDTILAEKGEPITAKGFSKPISTYRVRGIYDDLAAQNRVLRGGNEAISVLIDREKLDPSRHSEAIEILESMLSELKSSPAGNNTAK